MSIDRERPLPSPEAQSDRYSLTARYPDQYSSSRPYTQAQELIYQNDHLALSVFRLRFEGLDSFNDGYFVTVLGEKPSEEYQERFRRILSGGEEVELPPEAMESLWQRRQETSKVSVWYEGHYKHGIRRRIG
ncbi:MAG: hypothetical protein M3R24_26835 [Chloroflexota bacterium]|nr:hypothetical protein [Chloroflexota bacterium]